jgi:FKBP-type peptidyl-prolyl cis-trans isomerase FkpA
MQSKSWIVLLAALAAAVPATGFAAKLSKEDAEAYYYLGILYGREMAKLGLSEEEAEAAIKGLRAAALGEAEALDEPALRARLQELQGAKDAARAADEKARADAYLAQMAGEPGAVRTNSGIVYRQIEAGSGASPDSNSTVVAHYHGTLRDGSIFDSSVERGQPFRASLQQVIPCWREGIPLMKEGGRAKLTCPSAVAYGDMGSGDIPGGAAITFEIELIEVVD